MGLSTIDVTVTRTGDPCHISDREFGVYVLECCNGEVFTWCGRRYAPETSTDPGKPPSDWMRTKCGRLEFQLPPGCYIVGAVLTPARANPERPTKSLGNHLTHIAVVRVNCDDHVCVTLFDSSLHVCGTWFGIAAAFAANPGGGVRPDRELVAALQNAQAAVERVVKLLPADPIAETTRELALAGAPRQTPPAGGGQTAAKKAGAKKGGR